MPVSSLNELVQIERPETQSRRRSTWILKKAGQWLRLLGLVASKKGPSVEEGEDGECLLCGKEPVAVQEGVQLHT